MNRRQKLKRLKEENERLKAQYCIKNVQIVRQEIRHMRCNTFIDAEDWLPDDLRKKLVAERLATQMTDVIKDKVVEIVDSTCPRRRNYTFDFWVEE